MQEIQETRVRSLDQKDTPEKEMATHSRILAWEIPWTEEPGRLQFIGLQKAGGYTVPDIKTYYKHKIIKIMWYVPDRKRSASRLYIVTLLI